MAAGLDTFSMVGGFIEESTLNTEETLRGVDLRSTTDLTIAHSLLPMAIGTNLGIRRSVLDAVGGWYRSNLEIAKEGLAMIVRSFVDEGARRRTLWLAAGATGWAITDLLHYLPGDDKIETGIKQLWAQLEKNDTPHEALV